MSKNPIELDGLKKAFEQSAYLIEKLHDSYKDDDNNSPFSVLIGSGIEINSSKLVRESGIQLSYHGKCSKDGEENLDFYVWFDFSDPADGPGTQLLLKVSSVTQEITLNELGISGSDYQLISNADFADHTAFCESISTDIFDDYKKRFGKYLPKYGSNYYGKINQSLPGLESLSHILPEGSEFNTSYNIAYDDDSKLPIFFDVTVLFGNTTKAGGENSPGISLTDLSLGFTLAKGKTIADSDITVSIQGEISIAGLEIDFGGSYPIRGGGDISIFGSIKTTGGEILNLPEPEGLKSPRMEGDISLSFDKSFRVTHYELITKAENLENLFPGSPLNLPITITSAELQIEGENFSAIPSVQLQFTTQLFGKLEIDMLLSYPDKKIMARLVEQQDGYTISELIYNVDETLSSLVEILPHEVSSAAILNLELSGSLPEKTFQFDVELGIELSLGDFALEHLTATFHYQGGESPSYDFFVSGLFKIGDFGFVANVSYAKSENGNSFNLAAESSADTPIPIANFIGQLASKIANEDIPLPEVIKDFKIDAISLDFSSAPELKTFRFALYGSTKISKETLNWRVDLSINKKTDGTTYSFSGAVIFKEYEFDIDFDKHEEGSVLLATLSVETDVPITALLSAIAPDLAIPIDLALPSPKAFIAGYWPARNDKLVKNKTANIFGLELALQGKLDLGSIPGIGPLIGKADIEIDALRIVGSNANIDVPTLLLIDSLLTKHDFQALSRPSESVSDSSAQVSLKKGVALSADIKLPGLEVHLEHVFENSDKASANSKEEDSARETASKDAVSEHKNKPVSLASKNSQARTPTTSTPQKNRMLSPVGKQIGPFFLESLGLIMENGEVGLKFTGGVIVGPMALELINLKFTSPLAHFAPKFDLDGLAIGYDKAPLTVSGLLMKVEETLPEGANDKTVTQHSFGFRGGISIGFKAISITALGAYSHVELYNPPGAYNRSFHSLFLYGYLGAPLGGPPFLFVTGLALGVGFNRDLKLPRPENFDVFPLTAAALKPSGTALTVTDLKDMMLSLDEYIPIKEDNFWFAAGIKFESFKFLSGFLMLTLKFGEELEIGVLGIIDAVMPVGVPEPLVRISVGFSVHIVPERGVVEVKGSFLPSTFILHKDVKLQGGMALLAIMKDQHDGHWNGAKAGEFIFTLGGYGPLYKPKPYYPVVPALQLSWQVNKNLFITASAYFALTPEAIMMGGALQGLYAYKGDDVSVTVNFKITVDFILYWQPIQYLGQASAEFHIIGHVEKLFLSADFKLDAAAKLTIWGPEFSGRADLSLHFIVSFSVTVEFGAAKKTIAPISWKDFKESLLPPDDKVVSLNLSGGIVPESEQHDVPQVNPHDLRVTMDTQIPLTRHNGNDVNKGTLGIKPMALTSAQFESEVMFTITRNEGGQENLLEKFELLPIYKNVPSALWQPASQEGKIPEKGDQPALIENIICGYEIKPKRTEVKADDFVEILASSTDDKLSGTVAGLMRGTYDPRTELGSLDSLINDFYHS